MAVSLAFCCLQRDKQYGRVEKSIRFDRSITHQHQTAFGGLNPFCPLRPTWSITSNLKYYRGTMCQRQTEQFEFVIPSLFVLDIDLTRNNNNWDGLKKSRSNFSEWFIQWVIMSGMKSPSSRIQKVKRWIWIYNEEYPRRSLWEAVCYRCTRVREREREPLNQLPQDHCFTRSHSAPLTLWFVWL